MIGYRAHILHTKDWRFKISVKCQTNLHMACCAGCVVHFIRYLLRIQSTEFLSFVLDPTKSGESSGSEIGSLEFYYSVRRS